VEIALPVIAAAMAGHTDLAYRLICRDHGAEYCVTEMMLDRILLTDGKLRRRLVRLDDADHPVAGQLIGNDPETMALAAKVLCDMGFDVVDLNFACPVRKALARRRGGYLMSRPDLAVEIVRAVLAASSRPVTLKLRRRFREGDSDDACLRIAAGAFEAGAAAVCVHARSVEAKYTGRADWRFLALLREVFGGKTIIASGDALTPEAALTMLRETRADGVAVARGCLGNPWFFEQVRDVAHGRPPRRPTLAQQREVITRHFDAAVELYGPVRGPRHMRKFGIRYARMHPRPKLVRAAFVAVKRREDFRSVLEKYYADK